MEPTNGNSQLLTFDPSNMDGVDHINVYSKGKTELGRWMSNFTLAPIEHPVFGKFKCIEGLWYYLSRRDERLRDMVGYNAKQFGRNLPTAITMEPTEFKKIIQEALILKANGNPEMRQKLAQNTLPFRHYYVFSGSARNAGQLWILRIWEQIAKDARAENAQK